MPYFERRGRQRRSNFFRKNVNLPLYKLPVVCYTISRSRGISAAGSAQHWQCWGQRFESAMLHHDWSENCGFQTFFILYFLLEIVWGSTEPLILCHENVERSMLLKSRAINAENGFCALIFVLAYLARIRDFCETVFLHLIEWETKRMSDLSCHMANLQSDIITLEIYKKSGDQQSAIFHFLRRNFELDNRLVQWNPIYRASVRMKFILYTQRSKPTAERNCFAIYMHPS